MLPELGCIEMEESKLGLDRKGWHTIFLSLFVSSCYWFMSVYPAFNGFLFPFSQLSYLIALDMCVLSGF